MATKKVTKINKKTELVTPEIDAHEEEEDGGDIVMPSKKSVKPIAEIDTVDILPEIDEKVDDESVALEIEDEDSEDIPSLDEDDLNPFGDKWEQ